MMNPQAGGLQAQRQLQAASRAPTNPGGAMRQAGAQQAVAQYNQNMKAAGSGGLVSGAMQAGPMTPPATAPNNAAMTATNNAATLGAAPQQNNAAMAATNNAATPQRGFAATMGNVGELKQFLTQPRATNSGPVNPMRLDDFPAADPNAAAEEAMRKAQAQRDASVAGQATNSFPNADAARANAEMQANQSMQQAARANADMTAQAQQAEMARANADMEASVARNRAQAEAARQQIDFAQPAGPRVDYQQERQAQVEAARQQREAQMARERDQQRAQEMRMQEMQAREQESRRLWEQEQAARQQRTSTPEFQTQVAAMQAREANLAASGLNGDQIANVTQRQRQELQATGRGISVADQRAADDDRKYYEAMMRNGASRQMAEQMMRQRAEQRARGEL